MVIIITYPIIDIESAPSAKVTKKHKLSQLRCYQNFCLRRLLMTQVAKEYMKTDSLHFIHCQIREDYDDQPNQSKLLCWNVELSHDCIKFYSDFDVLGGRKALFIGLILQLQVIFQRLSVDCRRKNM